MALATAALSMRRVLAQDGTPVASPAGGEGERQSWLFSQTFTAGDWEPTADPASFTLRLRGGLANSVGFTDRPYRDTALLRTEELLPYVYTPTVGEVSKEKNREAERPIKGGRSKRRGRDPRSLIGNATSTPPPKTGLPKLPPPPDRDFGPLPDSGRHPR